MSYFLPHLPSGWHVDQAILSEDDRVVVIRFGSDGDSQCMKMDETLYGVAEKVQNFAVIYLADINQVPDFNKVRRTTPLRASGTPNRSLTLACADVRAVRPVYGDVLLPVCTTAINTARTVPLISYF